MKSDKLSKIKYKVEIPFEGNIRPGIDAEPTITIKVHGGTIRYRLVSFLLGWSDEPTCEGDIPDSESDYVTSWVSSNIHGLIAEAHLHHIVRFDKESKCYYDFISQTLFNADGLYEKKGSTVDSLKSFAESNGEPIRLPNRFVPFIEKLTQHPRIAIGEEVFLDLKDDAENYEIRAAKGNLSTNFSTFKKYDSSIDAKFKREKTGNKRFIYLGEPQEWFVGEKVKDKSLTIRNIFETTVLCDVLAVLDAEERELVYVAQATDVIAEGSIAFLGLNAEFLKTVGVNLEQLTCNNYFEPPDAFKSLLSKYCVMLEATWKQIAKTIEKNFLYSIGASTFYRETEELPKRLSDLNGYLPTKERLDNLLKRICPAIEETIRESKTGISLFAYCDTKVTPEKAIDYIVALVLSCLSDCHASSTDEKLIRLRGKYQQKLHELILKKFGCNPPGDNDGRLFNPVAFKMNLQHLLTLQDQLMSEGQYAHASLIEKYFTGLKELGYNDENSLLPPSMGRER